MNTEKDIKDLLFILGLSQTEDREKAVRVFLEKAFIEGKQFAANQFKEIVKGVKA